MTIANLDQVIAGAQPLVPFAKTWAQAPVAGRTISLWYSSGIPGPGTANTTLNGGAYSSSSGLVAGQLVHFDPAAGTSAYLSRLQGTIANTAGGSNSGQFYLCDRIWDNGGITITSTTAQTIVSPTWSPRDNNGSSLGAGVLLALEVSATTSVGTPTISVSYTNSNGTAGHTATNIDSTSAASTVGMFYRLQLQQGDIGVQSVQSLTFSGTAWSTGTVNLVAYRMLAPVHCTTQAFVGALDPVTGGLPQLYNGVVPFLVVLSASSSLGMLTGAYIETQG